MPRVVFLLCAGLFAPVTRDDASDLLFALGALGTLLHFPRREQVGAPFHKSLM